MLRKPIFPILLFCFLIVCSLLGQQTKHELSVVVNAIEAKNYKQAETFLQQYIQQLIASGNKDSVLPCIPIAGKIAYEIYGPKQSTTAVYDLINKAKLNNPDAVFHCKMYLEASEYFTGLGGDQHAYEAQQLAMAAANGEATRQPLLIAQIEYNLGALSQRLAQVNVSANHHRKALALREATPNTPDEDLYLSYNAMGSTMWYSSKYDSAELYYKKALASLSRLPENEVNRYYRPSIIQNNLAGLYGAEGKITEGINAMKDCISNTQLFIASPEPHPKKQSALTGLFEGIDNLAGLYKDIGDYHKAGDLLHYSYEQKKQKLNPGHPGIFISEILLGQHYGNIYEYDKSVQILLSGLEKLRKAEGDYLFWEADACYYLATAYENKKNIEEAKKYYAEGERLYDQSYQGEYDNIYLEFARHAASFYAANDGYEKAITMTKKGLDYIKKVQGEESLAAFYQLLNLAQISKTATHYQETIDYSDQALSILNRQINHSKNLLDSVRRQVYLPRAILLNLQAKYALQVNRDTAFLRSLSGRLQEALEILKRRRSLIDDEESINILMAENTDLVEFSKKIEMESYQHTHADVYLEKFINLHESGIYNRIRSRLDKAKLVQFAGIPASLQEEETRLKKAIPAALQAGQQDRVLMNSYLQASDQLNDFIEKIKIDYPAYYNLRYGSPFLSWEVMRSSVPENTTVIRYFFTDSSLFALVIDRTEKKMFSLNAGGLEEMVNTLVKNNTNETIQSTLLKKIYDQLWKPFEAAIHSENLIIIPDGILFALSFDLLTPQLAGSYKDVMSNSLLARHAISYNYSLYMVGNPGHKEQPYANYIAFVPGFSDKAKKIYAETIKDSVNLDYQYLSLLSQPHTMKVVQNIKRMIGGQAYLDNASTLNSFRQHAAGHTIIHIGTHAEFNNQLPERSRLIFSKNTGGGPDSNSLFLSAIYDCDMRSDLTILTACESGKPGYQDGEGMISIAHAFNYAGSRSILTGLWKIDEKASSFITESFVKNLHEGIPAALALRKAKLLYLGQAPGRTLAPAYWAGLVLIGQTTPLSLNKVPNYLPWWYAAGGLLLAALFIYFSRKRKGSSAN